MGYLDNAYFQAILGKPQDNWAELFVTIQNMCVEISRKWKWRCGADRDDGVSEVTVQTMSKLQTFRDSEGTAFSYFSTIICNAFKRLFRDRSLKHRSFVPLTEDGVNPIDWQAEKEPTFDINSVIADLFLKGYFVPEIATHVHLSPTATAKRITRLGLKRRSAIPLIKKLSLQGWGCRVIARELNSLGFVTKFRRQWNKSNVAQTMRLRGIKGKRIRHCCRYGFRTAVIMDRVTVVADKIESIVLARIQAYTRNGLGWTRIARELNEAGFRQRNGKQWLAGNCYWFGKRLGINLHRQARSGKGKCIS